jgi:predicted component of type VI protein secretion system
MGVLVIGATHSNITSRSGVDMASVQVIFGGQEQGKYALDRPQMVVGREPGCEITIDNLGISRKHCAFAAKGEAFIVQDLGSANGTFVNGKKIVEHFLNDGDEVVIGKYTLKFHNESQVNVAPEKQDAGVPDTLNTYVMDGAKIQGNLIRPLLDGKVHKVKVMMGSSLAFKGFSSRPKQADSQEVALFDKTKGK